MLPAAASTCDQLPPTHVATSVRSPIARSSTSRPCSIVESVAAAPCCHVTSTRCSLGLRSPSGRSPRPRCLCLDTLLTSPKRPVSRCPDRPLSGFRPIRYRCRRHPVSNRAAFQRPAHRRSGVYSTGFRPHTAEATQWPTVLFRRCVRTEARTLLHSKTARNTDHTQRLNHRSDCVACPATEAAWRDAA